SPQAQQAMEQVRQAIRQALPQAEEGISYAIPAFKVDGKFILYFSAAKKHIGLYPFDQAMAQALPQAANYDQSGKGTIRFPLNQPMPTQLIIDIAQHRLRQITAQ